MDPAHVFRQGWGAVTPRQTQQSNQPRRLPPHDYDDASDADGDGDGPEHRIAHTLTACCRCRQRKTRCDPTLPRCLPCERSGSTCEYLDTTKGRKINRYYVIKLQDKVKALEAELGMYLDEENDYPRSNEDMVRPGGLVRLSVSDDTPRYLGPSSGIAMTRLLIEEAKRYTDSNRISDLFPEVRARRQARMQSIQMTGSSLGRKSYPMMSQHPAENLPTRPIADKLVEIFNLKAQLLWPVLHEKAFQRDLNAVFDGDTDPYKTFVVRMVIAISLQKLDTQYAGLADSYFLAAMQLVEDVVRPKDLKTIQCLVLIGQYAMLTPTRTPVYYVLGLATKICQQEGLTDEQTITTGYNLDPLTIDMRRRLAWIVASMEYGLAHSMGRPNSYATGNDRMDVGFFASVDDECITETGILAGPASERKLIAIHLYRSRICEAEICRTLYERKKPEPKNDSHPWYQKMEKMMREWLDAAPTEPQWCNSWFSGSYHKMNIFLYRPSPQVPKPSPAAAEICYGSSEYIIKLTQKQLENSTVDITWVFLLSLTTSLDTLLWTTSFPEIRKEHPREEVEKLVNISLDVLDQCAERWPGSASSSQLYAVFSKACLLSYDGKQPAEQPFGEWPTLPTINEPNPSPDDFNQPQIGDPQQVPYLNPPQFGYVFDSPPESMNNYAFDPNYPPPQPTFRSNSIFNNPTSSDSNGRRFSYFPPDFQQDDADPSSLLPTSSAEQQLSSPPDQLPPQLPTPPESLVASVLSTDASNTTLSPDMAQAQTPVMPQSAAPSQLTVQTTLSPPQKPDSVQAQVPRMANFSVPPNTQPAPGQRPLPTAGDWFPPTQAFMAPYPFGSLSGTLLNGTMPGTGSTFGDLSDPVLSLQSLGVGPGNTVQFDAPTGRQGSLTQSQQLELMNVLETEGVGDIDAFLNAGSVPPGQWM